MGKRKSSKKPAPKKARQKLEVTFACPFCNAGMCCELQRVVRAGRAASAQRRPAARSSATRSSRPHSADKSVTCEMDREANIGSVSCTQCSAKFAVKIHSLSEPIDVYRCV